MRPNRWFLIAVVAAACARELPSETPLGVGPNAEVADASIEPDASPADAAAPIVEAAAPPSTEPADAAVSDAGATDAAPAADAAVADAASPAADAAVTSLAGTYRGEDTLTTVVAPLPKSSQHDPNARIDVTQPGGDVVVFTLINSGDGQPICSVKGKTSGGNVTLDADQTCAAFMGTGKIERSNAVFSGATLSFEISGRVEVQTPAQTLTGIFEYTFSGKRQ